MVNRKKHDQWYKKLFSNPILVRELFTSFVKEDFVRELNFSTLSRVDKSFVGDRYKERESDLIYQVRYRGKKAYIYLLIEFQSTVDRFMALRVLSYVAQFYMMLIEGKRIRKLPPVFPVVLYNGESKWNAPVSFRELVEDALPEGYVPDFRYYKIAENEFSKRELVSIRNAVSALFFIENSSVEDVQRSISTILGLLKDEGAREIELFVNWVSAYLRAEGNEDALVAIHEIQEAKSMWANAVEEYGKKIFRQGRQEGKQEGKLEGIQEATKRTVHRADAAGLSTSQIAEITGLSIGEIKAILAEDIGGDFVAEKRPQYGSKKAKPGKKSK